jgi:hypothetical protein
MLANASSTSTISSTTIAIAPSGTASSAVMTSTPAPWAEMASTPRVKKAKVAAP